MSKYFSRTAERRFKLEGGYESKLIAILHNLALKGKYKHHACGSDTTVEELIRLTKLGFSIDSIFDCDEIFSHQKFLITWDEALPGTVAKESFFRMAADYERVNNPLKPNDVEASIRTAYRTNTPWIEFGDCPVYVRYELRQHGFIFSTARRLESGRTIIYIPPCTK